MKLLKSFVRGFFSIVLLLLIVGMAIGIAFFGAWHQIFLLVPTIGMFVVVRNDM